MLVDKRCEKCNQSMAAPVDAADDPEPFCDDCKTASLQEKAGMRPMHPPHPKYHHVYAIIRRDDYLRGECEHETIKKIVWTRERALSEVGRLNSTACKGVHYRYQLTRLEKLETETDG